MFVFVSTCTTYQDEVHLFLDRIVGFKQQKQINKRKTKKEKDKNYKIKKI